MAAVIESGQGRRPPDFLFTRPYVAATLTFFLTLTGNGLFVLYPLRLAEMGKNEATIGFLMGVMSLAAFLTRPFIGSRIDRFGRRAFILAGCLGISAVSCLYALLPAGDLYIALLRLVHGGAFATFFTAIFTWVADYTPKERLAEGIGLFGMAGLMSAGAGPFLGEAVLRLFHGNFTPVFLTASLISFGGFLISTGIRDVRRTNHLPEFGFRGLLRRFDIATVLFASLVFGIAAGVVVNFIASYSRETALDSVAPFLISYSSAAVLVRLLASRASDLVGRTPIITPALLIFSVGLAALSFPVFFKYAWAIGFLMGCGHGLIYPAMNALAIERAGEKDMGSANALFSGAVDVGVFGGSVVFGEVAEAMSVRGMFLYCGLAVAGGLIIFLILEKVLCRSCTDGPNRAQQ